MPIKCKPVFAEEASQLRILSAYIIWILMSKVLFGDQIRDSIENMRKLLSICHTELNSMQ